MVIRRVNIQFKEIAASVSAMFLSACASGPAEKLGMFSAPYTQALAAESERFALSVQTPQLGDQPSLVQAQLAGTDVLGLFSVQSSYDVQRSEQKWGTGALGTQSLAQGVQTALPLPYGAPLQLSLQSRNQQQLTPTGLLDQQSRTAQARWSDGTVHFALDAHEDSATAAFTCGVDANLSAPAPEFLRDLAAQEVSLRSQQCSRNSNGGPLQEAEIVSAQARWDGVLGARRLRVSHVSVRNGMGLDPSGTGVGGNESTGVEIGARHSMEIDGWALSNEFTVRAPEQQNRRSGWAARSEIARKVFLIPVTASWQRNDTSVWSLGGGQVAGNETSLGFDFSAPLKQWLSPNTGGNLSYRRLDQAYAASIDEQIRLGLTLDW